MPIDKNQRRRNPPRDTYQNVPLTCGHTGEFSGPPPQEGDEIWCRKCSDSVRVLHSVERPFRVTCNGCPVNRNYGGSKESALRLASGHLIRFPAHEMYLWQGDKKIETITNNNAGRLFEQETVRRTQVHQGPLRNKFPRGVDRQEQPE